MTLYVDTTQATDLSENTRFRPASPSDLLAALIETLEVVDHSQGWTRYIDDSPPTISLWVEASVEDTQ